MQLYRTQYKKHKLFILKNDFFFVIEQKKNYNNIK